MSELGRLDAYFRKTVCKYFVCRTCAGHAINYKTHFAPAQEQRRRSSEAGTHPGTKRGMGAETSGQQNGRPSCGPSAGTGRDSENLKVQYEQQAPSDA